MISSILSLISIALSVFILKELRKMNATADSLAAEISNLQVDVADETTVVTSAVTLISGLAAQLAAALAAAGAAGATAEQLAALEALHNQLNANAASLASAVAANTPAQPTP